MAVKLLADSGSQRGGHGGGQSGRSDDGQAWVLLLFVVAAIVVATVGIAEFGADLVNRARARTAADAAALAGTTGGRAAAARMAARNGAVLVSYRTAGDMVAVEVDVEGTRAAAAATDAP